MTQAQSAAKTKAMLLSAICLALAIATTVIIFQLNAQKEKSIIDPPQKVMTYGQETYQTALQRTQSPEIDPEVHKFTLNVLYKDRKDYQAHLVNIATARGWLPYDRNTGEIKILLPKEQLESLQQAEKEPYEWLEQNRTLTPAQRPQTGETPAKALVFTSSAQGPIFAYLTAAIVAGWAAMGCGISALNSFLKMRQINAYQARRSNSG